MTYCPSQFMVSLCMFVFLLDLSFWSLCGWGEKISIIAINRISTNHGFLCTMHYSGSHKCVFVFVFQPHICSWVENTTAKKPWGSLTHCWSTLFYLFWPSNCLSQVLHVTGGKLDTSEAGEVFSQNGKLTFPFLWLLQIFEENLNMLFPNILFSTS